MTQLYWQVYLNLERELLALADTIYIDDKQQEVYSMRIADLLIRTVIEIEALAKELYLNNGGVVVPNDEMYFDTVCMAYLDGLWKLDKKVVQVVSPNIYLEKNENKILYPLHKASKRGTSSADWNKAYQAVKHNRVKELSKGSLKNLLHGLAALYVLNLYYKDERIEGLQANDKSKVDRSFGSKLFAVKIHGVNSLKSDGTYTKSADYDESVYIEDHEPNSKKTVLEVIAKLKEYERTATIAEIEKLAKEKLSRGEHITQEWVNSIKPNITSKIFPIKDYKLAKQINDGLGQLRFDIVLNKQQY